MKYRVMLADDEPIMRKALLSLIDWESIDCEVVYTAKNGEEVMENLEKMQPDILITDISMPGKDGVEIAGYIWEKKLRIKVIILTAYADFSYAQAAVRYGVSAYVTKTGAFDELLEAMEETKKKIVAESLPDREENFFKAVFDGSLYEEQEIADRAKQLTFSLNSYLILLMQLQQTKKDIRKSAGNFLHMVFQEKKTMVFPMERERFAVVLDDVSREDKQKICKQCEEILDMMENFAGLKTFLTVSDFHYGTSQIQTGYKECLHLMQRTFYSNTEKIQFYGELKKNSAGSGGWGKYFEELFRLVQSGKSDILEKTLNTVLDCMEKEEAPISEFYAQASWIQGRCRELLEQRGYAEEEEIRSLLEENPGEIRYIGEYKKWLLRLLEQVSGTLSLSVNKKQQILKECFQYIDRHYEENIQIADMARELGVSSGYLSRLVKEETGNTIISMIQEKKLEAARNYLENTDLKIYEIAEKLGFENTTYFFRFFKKHTGMSPGDYRGE